MHSKHSTDIIDSNSKVDVHVHKSVMASIMQALV